MKLESIIDNTEEHQRRSSITSVVKSLVSGAKEEPLAIEPKDEIVRFGIITEIEDGRVWINFHGNPMKSEVLAKYDCPDISIHELKELMEIIDVVKIKFKDLALKKPVVTDVYFSVSMVKYYKYL